jgi:hypothetical protein
MFCSMYLHTSINYLLHDAVSSSEFTASTFRSTVNNELERMWTEEIVA